MYAEPLPPAPSPSWFNKMATCCGPPSPGSPPRNRLRRTEKDVVWADEPAMTPPPSFAPPTRPPVVDDIYYGDDLCAVAPFRQHAYAQSGVSGSGSTSAYMHSNHTARPQRPRTNSSSVSSFFSLGGVFSSSMSSSSRRPLISAPTNFRHVHSAAFVFPPRDPSHQFQAARQAPRPPTQRPQTHQPRRPPSFEPIDVGCLPSPLLSSFERGCAVAGPGPGNMEAVGTALTSPPRAHTRQQLASHGSDSGSVSTTGGDSSGTAPTHGRSYSALSFHLPRRPVATGASCGSSVDVTKALPPPFPPSDEKPPVPARSRLRASSSPAMATMVERIASAMLEVEKLQEAIDAAVERQSIYAASSRPTTAYGDDALRISGDVPLPTVPALLPPAAAPSFAERLSVERPKTAPPGAESKPKNATSSPPSPPPDLPLAPPLPLVLRPPLRKKKSFSRVSTWLFQPAEGGGFLPRNGLGHNRGMSLDTVTNAPRPVTERDGFYSVMVPPAEGHEAAEREVSHTRPRPLVHPLHRRASVDSLVSSSTVDTLSTWTTGEGAQTAAEKADATVVMRQQPPLASIHPLQQHAPWVWPPQPPQPIVATRGIRGTPGSPAMMSTPTSATPSSATTATTTTTLITTTTATATPAAVESSTILLSGADVVAHRPHSVGVAF